MKVIKMTVLKQFFTFPPKIYVFGGSTKKIIKKSENCTGYATFKNHRFFTKFSSRYFWEESNFLTKSSLKWVKFDQWTSKMALMRDYTIVSEKMKLKLGKNAKYTPKKCPKLKKITQKFLPILVTYQL